MQISDVAHSHDGKYVFTSGGDDLCVNMWRVNTEYEEKNMLSQEILFNFLVHLMLLLYLAAMAWYHFIVFSKVAEMASCLPNWRIISTMLSSNSTSILLVIAYISQALFSLHL